MSVIIPYYQNQRTIGPCLSAFLAVETGAHSLDLVLIDDGSAPPLLERLPRHLKEHPKLQIIQTPHVGQTEATNIGAQHAQGEFLWFSCADILPEPNSLLLHLQYHLENKNPIVTLGPSPYTQDLKSSTFVQYLELSGRQFNYPDQAGMVDKPGYLYSTNFIVPKRSFLEVGGFDKVFPYGYQDYDLSVWLSRNGIHCHYIPDALVWHDHPITFEQYYSREQKVGTSTLDFEKRYLSSQFKRGELYDNFRDLIKIIKHKKQIHQRIDRLEPRIFGKLDLRLKSHEELYNLYEAALMGARIEGMLTRFTEMREFYKFPQDILGEFETITPPAHFSQPIESR
ncbi:MAG: glycosyltransferase [Myxococcota bacterium]|nr:glycosyltransferase [Myxococcota bacterium]